MVHVHPKFAVKVVLGVAEGLAGFGRIGVARGGVDQNAGSLNLLRLVGMENGHLVEVAIEGLGFLTGHQGHIGSCRARP